MGTRSESSTYIVAITLMTEDGELPTDNEFQRLVLDQMSGDLDEITGLTCEGIKLLRREDV